MTDTTPNEGTAQTTDKPDELTPAELESIAGDARRPDRDLVDEPDDEAEAGERLADDLELLDELDASSVNEWLGRRGVRLNLSQRRKLGLES